ncbi:MAG: diguanylate cyclase [Alphaproteobacteria bacterium]|nr:diguanylate cyclase [Alphaproteobacteria bacterium]
MAAGDFAVKPQVMVLAHQGPAFLMETGPRFLIANEAAAQLVVALEGSAGLGEQQLQAGRLRLLAALARGEPVIVRLSLPRPEDPTTGPRSFDLMGVPIAAAPAVGESGPGLPRLLVLGIETTLERNLTRALVASRELFRDLVSCSADFAFETDASGAFVYASPKGFIGYSAHALNGRQAQSLILRSRGAASAEAMAEESPFLARRPMEDCEMWLRGPDGDRFCVRVSAVPVHDETGAWRGARGVCRDVTELRHREAEIARSVERERTVSLVVEAMRQEIDPDEILRATAEATLQATRADLCWVLTADAHGRLEPARRHWVRAGREGSSLDPGAEEGALAQIVQALEAAGPPRTMLEVSEGPVQGLAMTTTYRGARNGALVLFRAAPEGASSWPQGTRLIVESVSAQAGLATAQASHTRTLKTLARTDALTGLLNRHAFHDEVAQRLAQRAEEPVPGAFLYIDLDHFKEVNDRLGHAAGDALLASFARRLADRIRPGDLAARLGGDEFAVWLEGCPRAGAVSKARQICELAEALRLEDGAPEVLSVSVGISEVWPGQDLRPELWLARADTALLSVKGRGRNGWAVWDPDAPKTAARTPDMTEADGC